MRDFDRQGLEKFLKAAEGEPPPVFAGREDILKAVAEAGRMAWNGKGAERHGRSKSTIIIQGAPGAGKSSTLAELRSRSAESCRRPGTPQVVITSSENVMGNLPGVAADIGAVAAVSWRGAVGRVKAAVGRFSGISVLGTSLTFSPKDKAAQSGAAQGIAVLSRLPPAKAWKTPVIVAIDEAQNLGTDRSSDHALFLQALHNASAGLPLTLVLAGLGDTRHVAGKCGLTRGLNTHDIAGLEPSDVDELMVSFCQRFGLDSAGCEERLRDLAAPAEGWPRHLHFAMQALAREALGTGGDLLSVNWPKIEREAAASRRRYYEGQISLEMHEAAGLTAAVMKEFQPGMRYISVRGLIETSVRDEPGFRLPEGMNVGGFLDCLRHNGALQETGYDGMTAPIPSFRSYLIAAGGLSPDPVPQRESRERNEFAGLLDEAAEHLDFAGLQLDSELQDAAAWSAVLNPGRSALDRLEEAGELADRLLSVSPSASALTVADRHRAKAEIALRSAVLAAASDTDPGERIRDALGKAERQLRSARRALRVDRDHEPISRPDHPDDDDAPSPM